MSNIWVATILKSYINTINLFVKIPYKVAYNDRLSFARGAWVLIDQWLIAVSWLSKTSCCNKQQIEEYYRCNAKPLHNSDTVSAHFNHFYFMGICDKLSRHLYMLIYTYFNMDECWLISSMP